MSRRGRKRKLARRQPNGQLARDRSQDRENILAVARQQPHRRKYGDEFRDQMAECELGRMKLDGVITAIQYDAGVRYREVVIGMRRAIGAPPATPKSAASILTEAGGRVIDMDDVDPEGAAQRANTARSAYAAAFRALSDTMDARGSLWRDAVLAVNDVAVWDRDRFSARGGIMALKAGLNVLARHFGLMGRRRARC